MDIKAKIESKKFVPQPLKDQFFLVDEKIIDDLIKFGEVNNADTVLEIGAGFGNVTKEIARSAKKVIAFEIDKRFKPYLDNLPKNVDLHFEDAWDYVQLHGKFEKRRVFNKIISNLPYSFCEKLLHNLTFLEYEKVVLLVPLKFVNTIKENGIFSSFFECVLLETVSRNSFFPVPKTNSFYVVVYKFQDFPPEPGNRYFSSHFRNNTGQTQKHSFSFHLCFQQQDLPARPQNFRRFDTQQTPYCFQKRK